MDDKMLDIEKESLNNFGIEFKTQWFSKRMTDWL